MALEFAYFISYFWMGILGKTPKSRSFVSYPTFSGRRQL